MSADAVLGAALAHPGLVRSVFVHEPALRGLELDPARRERVNSDFRAAIALALAVLRSGDARAAARMLMAGLNDQPGALEGLPDWLQRMAADNARTLPLQFTASVPLAISRHDLAGLDIPVRISCGERSRACNRLTADAAAQYLPRARLIVAPGARHLWPVQEPRAFTSALLGFLGDPDAG